MCVVYYLALRDNTNVMFVKVTITSFDVNSMILVELRQSFQEIITLWQRGRAERPAIHKTAAGKKIALETNLPTLQSNMLPHQVKLWSSQLWTQLLEEPEKFRTLTGFEPVTSRFRCDALTNWAMKPLTLGAGHLWVLILPWGMNQWTKWYIKWIIYKLPAPNVSGFIAQLVTASHRYREVTGSNPVEVLNVSGFSKQLLKLRP